MDVNTYHKIKTYINQNPVATLGTMNPNGTPHGAIVYVCAHSQHPVVYFVTKQETRKYRNLRDRHEVSLTIVNPAENSTLQANGRASDVEDAATINAVMEKLAHDHISAKEWLPPIAKLRAGAYTIVGIELTSARLAQFQGMAIGDEHIFTQW